MSAHTNYDTSRALSYSSLECVAIYVANDLAGKFDMLKRAPICVNACLYFYFSSFFVSGVPRLMVGC